MWKLDPPLSTVFRRRENDGEPVNDRRLRAAIAAGSITRIARGVYVDAAAWRRLTPQARHAQLVWEAAARTGSSLTFSHWAAAALHGIDILGSWPSGIDVTIDATTGGRSSGTFRRHARRLEQRGDRSVGIATASRRPCRPPSISSRRCDSPRPSPPQIKRSGNDERAEHS